MATLPADIHARNAALMASQPSNDNATDPWAHINRIMIEYAKTIVAANETAAAIDSLNADMARLTQQLIDRGRPDFTPMEAEHA